MMENKIIEVCKITPPLDSPADDIILPLTFFDLFNIIFPPVEILFFYETQANHHHHILLSKLKNSLSLTLERFLPVAGNLIWTESSANPIIRYQKGDGVLLTVTQSNDDFYHLSSKNIRESNIFSPYVAHMESGPQTPVIAFKITLFPEKGICIGVSVHHSLFDATSTTLFMNAWAHFAKFGEHNGLCKELVPDFDRKSIRERYLELEKSCIETLKQNDATLEKAWANLGPERLLGIVRGTFALSCSDVSKLKDHVNVQLGKINTQVPHISTFAVTYAYVILCLLKIKSPKNNMVNIAFSYECRGRLEPHLPKNYFGNAVGACDTRFDTYALMGNDGMARIVEFISKSTIKVSHGGPLIGAEEWLPNMFKVASDRDTLRVFVAGSSRFDYQSVDFGWGRPRKADIVSIDGSGGVIFTQGGDKNIGIEVELSMKEEEMEKFAYLFAQGIRNFSSGGIIIESDTRPNF